MENDVKVSIIIPVYNGEKYLERCLSSVVKQSIDLMEIVIINDGSTDKSQQIINQFAEKYENIISLFQENSGQGEARNRALDIIHGEYVMFIDSDDFIDEHAIEILYEEATKEKLDLVIYNWDKVSNNGDILEKIDHSEFDNKILSRQELIHQFLTNKKQLIEGFSWNKFIKRKIIDSYKIRYPRLKFEDIPTMFQVLTRVNTGKYLNKTLYHYVSHNQSTVHSMGEQNLTDFLTAVNMIEDVLNERNIRSQFEYDYFAYKANQLLREFGRSFDIINTSTSLSAKYKENLNQLTLKKCFNSSYFLDYKLVVKLLCYKLGVLHLLITLYHKIKPIN